MTPYDKNSKKIKDLRHNMDLHRTGIEELTIQLSAVINLLVTKEILSEDELKSHITAAGEYFYRDPEDMNATLETDSEFSPKLVRPPLDSPNGTEDEGPSDFDTSSGHKN